MRSRTIRLDNETYERLKSEKRPDETFSEAVERLLGDGSLLDLVGLWSEEEVGELREELDDVDRASTEDIDETVARIEDGE